MCLFFKSDYSFFSSWFFLLSSWTASFSLEWRQRKATPLWCPPLMPLMPPTPPSPHCYSRFESNRPSFLPKAKEELGLKDISVSSACEICSPSWSLKLYSLQTFKPTECFLLFLKKPEESDSRRSWGMKKTVLQISDHPVYFQVVPKLSVFTKQDISVHWFLNEHQGLSREHLWIPLLSRNRRITAEDKWKCGSRVLRGSETVHVCEAASFVVAGADSTLQPHHLVVFSTWHPQSVMLTESVEWNESESE